MQGLIKDMQTKRCFFFFQMHDKTNPTDDLHQYIKYMKS